MSDILILEENIGEDGKLVLQIPPDGPRGDVQIIVKQVTKSVEPEISHEDVYYDAELEELLSDENLNGLGLTAEESVKSPAIGMWKDRADMVDSVQYVQEMRRKRRERRLSRD